MINSNYKSSGRWGKMLIAAMIVCIAPVVLLYYSQQHFIIVHATAGLVTDASLVLTTPVISQPPYLSNTIDPTFNTTIARIANDTSLSTTPISGTWGADTRHVYSKQQPWNADQTMFIMENRDGGSPSPIILNGSTFQPLLGECSGFDNYDYRWHPDVAHKNEQIAVTAAGTELMWYDVVNCVKTRTWTLPITANYGIGSGEGNTSSDGRFVVIGNDTQLVVVDMDPQAPSAAYPNKRIGLVYTIPVCDFGVGVPCNIGNVSVSPGGNFVDLKYSGPASENQDAHRIFDIDPSTLALSPHTMAIGSVRCGSFSSRNDGWIFPLKHADMTFDPTDNNAEIIVGGRACSGSTIGRVVKVRLSDGLVTPLTDPNNESSMMHVSARNYNRLGWVYVTYDQVAGKIFNDEIVAIKTDGSLAVERLSFTRTNKSGCYRCQSHAVPSPDGFRAVFASNWALNCGTGCGLVTDIKDYVIDTRPLRATPDTSPPIISNAAAGGLTTSSTVITWTTDELATSQVQYGTTQSYGSSSVLDANAVSSHSVSLTGLQPNTLYQYRVLSKDASDNLTTGNNNSFTTSAVAPPPPDTTPPSAVIDLTAT